jgi:hypothetical protein
LTGKLAHSQSIYIINNDSLTCLSEKELDIVIGAFIERDGCLEAYDTLAVGYDAAMNANSELEAINTILVNDLEMSKAVSQGLEAEKIEVEKQLKKKVRQNKIKEGLLWAVSGVVAACMILYLVK